MHVGEKLLYLLAGTGLGAAVGILLAPSSGQEMRQNISSTVSDTVGHLGRGRSSEAGERTSPSFSNVIEKGKNVASIGRPRVTESVEAGKSEYERQRPQDRDTITR